MIKEFQVRRVLLATSLLFSQAVMANDLDPCQSGSAMGTIGCNEPRWKAAEQLLQKRYDRYIAFLKRDSPHLVKDMVASQRTWIRFREQYCDVYGRSRVEGNSWTGFWISECMASEASRRADSLKLPDE